jgi:hypothetical protein
MTPFEVPLTAQAQTFSVAGSVNTYNLRVTWCGPSACWILDIYDGLNAPLVLGIPMVTGVDLLAQYEYLGIGGALVVQTDSDPGAVPTYQSLGITGHLYYVVNP